MAARHGNKQKHESRNPVQRALLGRFKSEAIRLIRSVDPSSILEVGCGEGYMLDAIAAANLGIELHGVDISAAAIDEARSRLGGRAKLEVRDARELADGATRYDLVMMLEVLEHIENPAQMLPILQRLTAGPVLLSVPWEPFFRGLNFIRGKNLSRWGNDPEHVNHWGRQAFLDFLGPHFQILETPQVFPWTMALVTTRSP
jgi:2-polyprenyl-3-methyl-5-hydroxy-6-metoxy-1,4-benzoquinol methylase